jgi:DNA gyrase subunit A
MKEEDVVERLWIANTHDTLLVFTSAGRVFWLKVYKLPDAGPNARGKPIVNLLPLEPDEKVQAVQPVREFSEDRFVFFATRNGTVKKTPLTEFAFQLQRGKIAIGLDEGDALVDVQITDGARDILLFASNGKAVRFDESSVRSMGRTATGVRGMRLAAGETVVSLIVADGEDDILTATERGYGKRTPLVDYPRKGRGTQGVIAIQCSDRNGALIGAVQLGESHELMLISNQGTLVRTRATEIARVGRNTQGVTLIRLPADEALVGVVKVESLGDAGDAVAGEGEAAGDAAVAPPSE